MTWANWQYASLVCGTNQLPTQTAPHQRRHRSRRNRRKSPKLKRRGRIRAAPTRGGLRRPQMTRRTRSRLSQTTSRPSRSPRPTRNQATPGPSPSSSKGSARPASVNNKNRVGAYARRYKTRMCIYGDACPYGPGRCFFAHDAAELRPPQARWWLPEYKTKPCRYAASECPFYADGRCQYAHTVRGPASPSRTESRMCTAAGRGAPVRAAASRKNAGPEVQDAHVPLRRGRVPLRRELLLRAQRRSLPRGKINSSRRRRESGSVRAQEELRPLEPDEPPGEPTDVVSRLERLRALRDGGSLSAVEFEVLKQQVLREPGSFAAQTPAPLAPTAPPPPRRLSPPPPDAYMLPAMAMPPRAVPRPPAYEPPYAAVPGPPRGYGVPQLVPRGYGAPPPPYASVPRPPRPPDPRYGPQGYAPPRSPRYAYGAPPPQPRPPYEPRAPPRPPL